MSGCSGSLGSVKIPYYLVINGRGYWRPHPRMHAYGFQSVPCGPDGPDAWEVAQTWNKRWQAVRRGEEAPPIDLDQLDNEQAEAARRYPPGSVGAAFQVYIRTEEWKKKALSTRLKIWWPCWFRIRDMWGDVLPDSISFEQMSAWRAALERKKGVDVAHKTLKTWRALWNVMLGLKVARGADPSTGVRNVAPRPRHQRWSEGEAVRLAKGAWRMGFRGLACVIATCWDTGFQPGDARTLCGRHVAKDGQRTIFDRQEDGRKKTGRAVIGTISRRSERLVWTYLANIELLPDAILFRNRSGEPYREDTLADDFAIVRKIVFPGDTRRLMDMRRSGVVEAVAGDVAPLGLSAKLANSIDRSNTLHKTYAPVDIAAVRAADEARLRGRRKMRAANEDGPNVSKHQPGRVSKPGGDAG